MVKEARILIDGLLWVARVACVRMRWASQVEMMAFIQLHSVGYGTPVV